MLHWNLSLLVVTFSVPSYAFSANQVAQRRNFCSSRFSASRCLTAVSNPFDAAVVLQIKEVQQKIVKRKPPREFSEVWDELQKEIGLFANNPTKQSADVVLDILSVPICGQYSSENEFDAALFRALGECCSAFVHKEVDKEEENNDKKKTETNFMILTVGKTEEYAIGFARQQPVARNLVASKVNVVDSGGWTTVGMNLKSVPDHAVCLFAKRRKVWKVLDCFSLIELKLSDATCDEFDLDDMVRDVYLDREHSALGQAILYNMEYVLLHHARRGVLRDHLPLAILAGKKDGDENLPILGQKVLNRKGKVRPRWVSGEIEVPAACGDCFVYTVQDFGPFSDDIEVEDLSIRQALSLYLDTLLFGIKAAVSVLSDFVNNDVPRPAVPASGLNLMIHDAKANLQFCASPITGANDPWVGKKSKTWKSSQGDIFKGSLNLGDLLKTKTDRRSIYFFDEKEEGEETNVVVKVSSIAVHNLLINPDKSFLALVDVGQSPNHVFLKEIRSVLKAVIRMGVGCVAIMEDLSKKGYEVLKPKDHPGELAVLWGGFRELVETVLIPLAEINVIHPDIRSGFDVTANILCRFEKRDGRIEKTSMKLIDLESLVAFTGWRRPLRDGRYFQIDVESDATTFVWWQCIGLAYTWKERIVANELRDKGMTNVQIYMSGSGGPEWMEKFRPYAATKKISTDQLRTTLHELSKEFS